MTQESTPAQVAEGETINLTKINQKVAKTIDLTLKNSVKLRLPRLFNVRDVPWPLTKRMKNCCPVSRAESRKTSTIC